MKITTTKKFDRQFKKQPLKIKNKFEKRVEVFLMDSNNPILNTHKLSGKLKNLWSFNITGDIRVVFDRSHEDIVIFEAIGSHSKLYS